MTKQRPTLSLKPAADAEVLPAGPAAAHNPVADARNLSAELARDVSPQEREASTLAGMAQAGVLGHMAQHMRSRYQAAVERAEHAPVEPGGECPVIDMELDEAVAHNIEVKKQKL